MRLLARREHTQHELRRKLADRADAATLERLLQELVEQGMQSDERFAEIYVILRREKGYGPLRIQVELKEKGISGTLIDCWLDEGDTSWQDRMKLVAIKKYGEPAATSQKEMAQRGRFLTHRGFPPYLINDYLFNAANQ